MRNAFAAAITELAERDERVVLLSGDIGNRLFDTYKAKFPKRFFNCGVAEANMTGLAAGMALCGLRPFTYTITPFATTRAMEQIKVDVCYHKAPVVIVGTGSGLSYASLGPTHHSCDDVAMLRSLPNMTIVCPGDVHEVRAAVATAPKVDGPVYIRIGKKGEPVVHQEAPPFTIGKAIRVREGTDVCLLGMGNMLPVAVDAATALATKGLSARVYSMHTVKPLEETLLAEVFARFPIVAVLEEHSRIGGLGSAVAEWLAQQRTPGRLLAFGTRDEFVGEAGSQKHFREQYGLTAPAVADRITQFRASL